MGVISVKQASVLLFLSLAGEALVRPFGAQTDATAQVFVLAAVVQTVFLWAFVWLLAHIWPAQGPSVAAVAGMGLVCLAAAASVLLRTEQFYRYICDEPLPIALTLGLLLLCMAYALSCHTDALARAGGLLFWLFCFSLILLFVASAPAMQQTNLAPAQGPEAVLSACLYRIQLPVELLVCQMLCKETAQKAKRGFWAAVAGAGLLRIALAFGTELVLGTNARGHAQILNTLTRIGGISVFQRLDAVHAGVWLLLLLLQAALLLIGAKISLKLLWRHKNQKSIVTTGVLLGTLLPSAVIFAFIPQNWHAAVLSVGTLFVVICMIVQGGTYAKRLS